MSESIFESSLKSPTLTATNELAIMVERDHHKFESRRSATTCFKTGLQTLPPPIRLLTSSLLSGSDPPFGVLYGRRRHWQCRREGSRPLHPGRCSLHFREAITDTLLVHVPVRKCDTLVSSLCCRVSRSLSSSIPKTLKCKRSARIPLAIHILSSFFCIPGSVQCPRKSL
jgi:hypothetical protein